MADISVERKERSFWPWILGLLLLALLAWALMSLFDGGDEESRVEGAPIVAPVATAPEAVTPGASADSVAGGTLPVAAILTDPGAYVGQTVQGQVRVTGDPTDRGFWIEENGQRLFSIIDEPKPEIKDLNEGQTVRISQATVYDASTPDQIPGPLEAETLQTIQGQPAVLYVRAVDIEIVSRTGP